MHVVNEIGYIKGHTRVDGYFWISEFVVHRHNRGKGMAKTLAACLPQKCKLLACPMYGIAGPTLTKERLVLFYESIGFVRQDDELGNTIMTRE